MYEGESSGFKGLRWLGYLFPFESVFGSNCVPTGTCIVNIYIHKF